MTNAGANQIVVAGWPELAIQYTADILKYVHPRDSEYRNSNRLNLFSERIVMASEPADVEELRRRLGPHPESSLLVFIEGLASVLSRELPLGPDADFDCVNQWQNTTDKLLGMQQLRDSRVKFFSVEDVIGSSSQFVAHLSELLGLDLALSTEYEPPRKSKWDDFYLMVAHQYIADRPRLDKYCQELASRRSFIPLQEKAVDWSAVLEDVESLRRENASLLEMLHRVQLDFEETMSDINDRKDAVEERDQKIMKITDRLASRELALKRTQKSVRTLEEKLAKSERERRKIKARLVAIESSTSWTMTAPVRGLISRLVRK